MRSCLAAKYPYYLLADSPEGIKKDVTLGSIANNLDIKESMTRQQIDAVIARNAETETLYDQPGTCSIGAAADGAVRDSKWGLRLEVLPVL